MKCTVKKIGDYKVFDVDGKTVYPGAYMSYAPLQEDIDEMKEAGIKLFMFGNYVGDEGINAEAGLRPFSNNFFKGYGKYDFSFSGLKTAAINLLHRYEQLGIEYPLKGLEAATVQQAQKAKERGGQDNGR